jgi:nitroimidazol reductase NimA-like FMN-containing flavoprotein (pyridoxamine 5'-phosphate oxidase superfamily)
MRDCILDRDECVRLLGRYHLGRIGVVVDKQPLIFPVNYTFWNGDVVFRTDEGTKLHGALHGKVVFEIDEHDRQARSGWSVMVVGECSLIDDPRELRDALRFAPVGPWVPGPKPHWMRIRPAAITGRRIARA